MKIYALLAAVSLVGATAARGDEALTRLQSDVASMSGEAFAEVDALEEHIMIDPSCARSMLNGGMCESHPFVCEDVSLRVASIRKKLAHIEEYIEQARNVAEGMRDEMALSLKIGSAVVLFPTLKTIELRCRVA